MPLETHRVHVYQKGPGITATLIRVNPLLTIRYSKNRPPVLVQGGNFYSEGGEQIFAVPDGRDISTMK